MQFKESRIAGVIEIIPRIFTDERGLFFESYNQKEFEDNKLPFAFIQDNQSFSVKGTLRGLHFQNSPFAQGKLVRVITGKVLDVAVDMRPDSATFGQHETFILDDLSNKLLYIPEGFAHGFLALEDSILSYKCTQLYNKASESGISWNDPQLGIQWGIDNPIVSEKDQLLPTFQDFVGTINPAIEAWNKRNSISH
ncbi:MAG: dTDP-4-dehydrorhamnose 3,5-epimerase [Bacteroidota bacterium]